MCKQTPTATSASLPAQHGSCRRCGLPCGIVCSRPNCSGKPQQCPDERPIQRSTQRLLPCSSPFSMTGATACAARQSQTLPGVLPVTGATKGNTRGSDSATGMQYHRKHLDLLGDCRVSVVAWSMPPALREDPARRFSTIAVRAPAAGWLCRNRSHDAWRLRYELSLPDLAETFLTRGMVVSHEADGA
jgi:hypothetical protein